MIAFEVRVNGRLVCCAGVGEVGVLSAIVNWMGDSPRSPRVGGRTKGGGEARISVAGSYETSRGSNVSPRWLNRMLNVGDEISIRVVKKAKVDRPERKQVTTADMLRKAELEIYQELKTKFEQGESRGPSPQGRLRSRHPRGSESLHRH